MLNYSTDIPLEVWRQIERQIPAYEKVFVFPLVCRHWHEFCQLNHKRIEYINSLVTKYFTEKCEWSFCTEKSPLLINTIHAYGLSLINTIKEMLCYPPEEMVVYKFFCKFNCYQGYTLTYVMKKINDLFFSNEAQRPINLFASKWQLHSLNKIEQQEQRTIHHFTGAWFKNLPSSLENCLSFFSFHNDEVLIQALFHLNIYLYNERFVDLNLKFLARLDFYSLILEKEMTFYCDPRGVIVDELTDCTYKIFIIQKARLSHEIELLNYNPTSPKNYYLPSLVLQETTTSLAKKHGFF